MQAEKQECKRTIRILQEENSNLSRMLEEGKEKL